MSKRRSLFSVAVISSIILVSCSTMSAKKYYKEGIAQFQLGDYQEAVNNFDAAINKNDEKADYYLGKGFALIELGQYEEARTQFEKVMIEKDSQVVRENTKLALRGQGIAYYKQGDYENAVLKFEKALEFDELKKIEEDILSYEADCYLQLEQYDQAVLIYTKLIEYNKSTANLLSLYQVQVKAGLQEEAIKTLEKAAQLSAKTVSERLDQARVAYYQGNIEQAIEQLEKLQLEDPKANYYLGEIRYERGEKEQAVEALESYLSSSDTTYVRQSDYLLARCYMDQSEYEKALTYIENGLSVTGTILNKELKQAQVATYEQLAEFNKAYELAASYVEEYPEDEAMNKELVFLETRKIDTNQ